MARSYAVSLGALALGMIALRGATGGELASEVLTKGLLGMIVFSGVGYVIGAIADSLVCQTVEQRFRQRLAEVIDYLDDRAAEKNG